MTNYEKFLQQNLEKQIIEVCSGSSSKINKMVEVMRGIENE